MTITPISAYGTAKFIVSATPGQGNYTTIAAAMAAASSGDTIFVRDGTYTEDFTAKAGVTLTAWTGNELSQNVKIIGKITYSDTGIFTLSNIFIQTNSDFFLVVSGSNLSIFYFTSCNLNCTNNTGISFTSSNASSNISILDSIGNLGTTGIAFYSSSSPGLIDFVGSDLSNIGNSLTANTNSDGIVASRRSAFGNPFTTSGTGGITMTHSQIATNDQNQTCLTHNGTGPGNSYYGLFNAGTASAISVGAGATLILSTAQVASDNVNAITGAGTLNTRLIVFEGTSSTINTSTVNTLAGFP